MDNIELCNYKIMLSIIKYVSLINISLIPFRRGNIKVGVFAKCHLTINCTKGLTIELIGALLCADRQHHKGDV